MEMVAKMRAEERDRKSCLCNKIINFVVFDDQNAKGKKQEKMLKHQDL